jgi:hypothetical protein
MKFKEIMRLTSYLLPPNQRTVARFMNLSITVEWAKKLLSSFIRLTTEEKAVFGFIKKHTTVITELSAIFERLNNISRRLKNESISHKSIQTSIEELQALPDAGSPRMLAVVNECIKYLNEEKTNCRMNK